MVIRLICCHGPVAILDWDVLDDGLEVCLMVPFSIYVFGVVVRDEVSVSELIHHWYELRLKRLNIFHNRLILRIWVFMHWLWLMEEWTDVVDLGLFVNLWVTVSGEQMLLMWVGTF